jgi:RecB family exonuclease
MPILIPSGKLISEQLLAANRDKPLSPSAIISYMQCSLRFYYRYIAGLKEADEVSEDIDRQRFGTLFHKAAENLYHPLLHKTLDDKGWEQLAHSEERIRESILKAFATEYFKVDQEEWRQLPIEGQAMLIQATVREYIRHLLEVDRMGGPTWLHALELECETSLEVPVNGMMTPLRIGGKVDRVDEQGGKIRVIDYKTGSLQSSALAFTSLDELFAPEVKKLKKEVVQALIYAFILRRGTFSGSAVTAVIYSILNLRDEKFRVYVEMNKNPVAVEAIEHELEEHLRTLLGEIFSQESVFRQTPFRERCDYCPYNVLCRR